MGSGETEAAVQLVGPCRPEAEGSHVGGIGGPRCIEGRPVGLFPIRGGRSLEVTLRRQWLQLRR